MSQKKHVRFIVNPISGINEKESVVKAVEETIDREKYDFSILSTLYAGHAEEIARMAANEGVDIVAAVGGDGTINEVGRALAHTETAMAVVPCGSGNGLARHLRIPINPMRAVKVINEGQEEKIDYGIIDGHPFFCTCGVGFDAFVSLKFANSGKRGILSYLENALRESVSYSPETYEIENSEGTVKYKAFLITCANASQYGNNAFIAPHASLTDGLMDITVLEPFSVIDVPTLSYQLFNKTIDQNSRIKTMRDTKITIRRAHGGVLHYDGDPVMGGKTIEVEIVHQGLKVIVPNPNDASEPITPSSILQHITEFLEVNNEFKPRAERLLRRFRD